MAALPKVMHVVTPHDQNALVTIPAESCSAIENVSRRHDAKFDLDIDGAYKDLTCCDPQTSLTGSRDFDGPFLRDRRRVRFT